MFYIMKGDYISVVNKILSKFFNNYIFLYTINYMLRDYSYLI